MLGILGTPEGGRFGVNTGGEETVADAEFIAVAHGHEGGEPVFAAVEQEMNFPSRPQR